MSKQSELRNYLLVFDRVAGQLVDGFPEEFENADAAMAAYFSKEKEVGTTYEVLLVAAGSLDEVRATHSSYFARASDDLRQGISDELASLAS